MTTTSHGMICIMTCMCTCLRRQVRNTSRTDMVRLGRSWKKGKEKNLTVSTCTWQRAQYADGARGLGPGTVIYAGTAWNGNHDS